MTPDDPLPTASPRRTTPGRAALYAAALCATLLHAAPSDARKAKPPRAASTPSTAQILAPSRAAEPDPLPAAHAIYRCGNTYSPNPCGATVPLDVSDARSDAQRRQAEELGARDRRLAQWLEAGRRERDAVASEPARRRAAADPCVDTQTMVCRPRKPKPRHAVSKAASAAAARISPG